MRDYFCEAIKILRPTSAFGLFGDKIKWNDPDNDPPTQAEIDAEVQRLQEEHDSQEYARNRKAEYDALNQLEMQFDDKEDGTTTWEDAIKAIKAKYPKG
ncbi:MAG TPA: hypothetical protein DEZ08_09000 [Dehalococcoidia bacterium]|jgi:hypothetical protein|nr:hypothetical protein [Dehalococcoidia bacterium]|tara:strand:+ start:96 stop:392 length:297 start_codon:yes stop_codon:yes gene_type:complete